MLKTITNWFISFIHIQLIITLFSLPIFVLWGLPVSSISLLGNLIFSPLLVLFIGLCCLITFCSLFAIPHTLLLLCLEKTSNFWYKILSFGSPYWLTGYSIKTLPVILISCTTFYIFYTKWNPGKKDQIVASFALLSIIFTTNQLTKKTTFFSCDHTYFLHHNNKTYCIDNGTFSRKRSAQSWIDYTALPHLIYYTGSPKIDHFISYKNNKRTYYAAKQLQRQTGIKTVHLKQ